MKKRLQKKVSDTLGRTNRHELKRMVAIVTEMYVVEKRLRKKDYELADKVIKNQMAHIEELQTQLNKIVLELPFWKRKKIIEQMGLQMEGNHE